MTSRTFHSVHGVGAVHWSAAIRSIRSPVTADARARPPEIAEFVTRRGYDTTDPAPHWFSAADQAVVVARPTRPDRHAGRRHAGRARSAGRAGASGRGLVIA